MPMKSAPLSRASELPVVVGARYQAFTSHATAYGRTSLVCPVPQQEICPLRPAIDPPPEIVGDTST
jgi:hypothetical protein